MSNVIQPSNKYRYKLLTLLSLFYVTVLLMTLVVENRLILMGDLHILSGTLVLPLSYSISDIITEVYGYKQMRRLIWMGLLVLYFSALVVYILLHLPTDPKNIRDPAYTLVLDIFPTNILTYSVAALVSIFLNSFILSKLKIVTKGRVFWLRSLGSTILGEGIFILVWAILGFRHAFPLHELLQIMLISYLVKIIYNLVAIIPTAFLTSIIKAYEGVDVYDYGVAFNPFSLKE